MRDVILNPRFDYVALSLAAIAGAAIQPDAPGIGAAVAVVTTRFAIRLLVRTTCEQG